jgi:hypothetical protein
MSVYIAQIGGYESTKNTASWWELCLLFNVLNIDESYILLVKWQLDLYQSKYILGRGNERERKRTFCDP